MPGKFGSVEALKKLKFGYRAKYIINTIEKFFELKKVSGKATDAEFLLQNISPLNDTKRLITHLPNIG